jgi:hypothetical protein
MLQVYARFLEYVRNEPGAASRFYEAAIKAGTSESLLALTAAEGGTAGLAAAGQIDEKIDGLAVINAQVRWRLCKLCHARWLPAGCCFVPCMQGFFERCAGRTSCV